MGFVPILIGIPSERIATGTKVMTKINKDVKKLWTAALRSGEYRQTTGVLKAPSGGYCCLGVLLSTMEGESCFSGNVQDGYEAFGRIGCLPQEQAQNYGIDANTESKLVELNDDDGKSFAQIADWIDSNL